MLIKLLFAAMWCSFGLIHLRRTSEITSYEGMTPHDLEFDHRRHLATPIDAEPA